MSENQNLLIKGLLYKSNYRGCKETDILVGKYANEFLSKMNDMDLELFQKFIDEDDAYIYDWVLEKSTCPTQYQELIIKIREFHDL